MADIIPPPPADFSPQNQWQWLEFYKNVRTSINNATVVSYTTLDFSGANITSIPTRNHNDLTAIQGGTLTERYHFTLAEYTGSGTGVLIRAVSPTLTTPNIGVATGTSLGLSGDITTGTTTLHKTSVALSNGAGVGLGTITNAPVAGNPTKWLAINDNGTIRYVPAW